MSILGMSLSLVFALIVGVVLGVRFTMRWLVKRLTVAWKLLLDNPENRNALSVNWAFEQVHERIVAGTTIEALHEWLHAELDRSGKPLSDAMRDELRARSGASS